jgi:ethanolamine transporter EutH
MLLPLIPAFGILAWQVRMFRKMDEMQARHQLLAVVWAFAGTAAFSIAYALLEVVGWPRLPMFAIWMLMLSLWILSSWTQRIRYR